MADTSWVDSLSEEEAGIILKLHQQGVDALSEEEAGVALKYADKLRTTIPANGPSKRKTSVGEDVGIGLKNLGHTASTAGKLVAGGVLSAVGAREASDRMFGSMEQGMREHDAEMQGIDQGLGGQIISGVVGAAPMIAAAPFGAAAVAAGAGGLAGIGALENTAEDIRAGANMGGIKGVAKTVADTGLNAAANMLPAGRGLVKGAMLGAGGNLVSQAATDITGQMTTSGTDAAKRYEITPDKYLVTGAVGGVVGGGLGHLTRTTPSSSSAADLPPDYRARIHNDAIDQYNRIGEDMHIMQRRVQESRNQLAQAEQAGEAATNPEAFLQRQASHMQLEKEYGALADSRRRIGDYLGQDAPQVPPDRSVNPVEPPVRHTDPIPPTPEAHVTRTELDDFFTKTAVLQDSLNAERISKLHQADPIRNAVDEPIHSALGKAATEGSVRSGLELFKTFPNVPAHLRILADHLLSNRLIGHNKVGIDPASKFGMQYDRRTGQITAQDGRIGPTSFIHEVVHSAANRALDLYRQGKDHLLTAKEIAASRSIIKLWEDLRTTHYNQLSDVLGKDHADIFLANERELVTYGLTDPRLQGVLNQIKYEKGQSFFRGLVDRVTKLFGFDQKAATALKELYSNAGALIDESTGQPTPTGVRGSDPVSFAQNKPLAYTRQASVSDVLAQSATHSDIGYTGKNVVAKMVDNLYRGLVENFTTAQAGNIYNAHPSVRWSVDRMIEARRATEREFNRIFGASWRGGVPDTSATRSLWNEGSKVFATLDKVQNPDSIHGLMKKVSDAELSQIFRTYQDAFIQRSDPSQMNLSHLNQNQRKLIDVMEQAHRHMWELASTQYGQDTGKTIPYRPGWFPYVRNGDHYADVQINGVTVRVEHFRSAAEAKAFKDRYDANKLQGTVEIGKRVREDSSLSMDIMRRMIDDIYANDPDGYKQANDQIDRILDLGKHVGSHHRKRRGYAGYEGDTLFASASENGRMLRSSYESAIKEYLNSIEQMKLGRDMETLLYSTEKDANNRTVIRRDSNDQPIPSELKNHAPNAYDLVKFLYETSQGKINKLDKVDDYLKRLDNPFVEAVNAFKKVTGGNDIKLEGHVLQTTVKALNSLFYVINLTTKPSQWITQVIGASNQGFVTFEQGLLKGMTNSLVGTFKALTPSAIQKDKDFVNAVFHVSQHSNVFHPQLTNELTHLANFAPDTRARKVAELLTGETFTAKSDSLGRYLAFAGIYQHYKSLGMTGKELINAAMTGTNKVMFEYNKRMQPAVFQSMGMVGEVLTPLKTYAMGMMGNFIESGHKFASNPSFKAAAPFVGMTAIAVLQGGIISAPLIIEYEILRKLAEAMNGEPIPWLPNFTKWAMGDGDVAKAIGRGVLNYTTGLDFGSSLRMQDPVASFLDPSKSFGQKIGQLSPTAGTVADIGNAVVTAGKNVFSDTGVPPNEARNAALAITPAGPMRAAVDILKYDMLKRPSTIDKQGNAVSYQTGADVAGAMLGIKSDRASQVSSQEYIRKMEEQKLKGKITRLLDIASNPKVTKGHMQAALQELKDEGYTGQEISAAIQEHIKKGMVPAYILRLKTMADNLDTPRGRLTAEREVTRFKND